MAEKIENIKNESVNNVNTDTAENNAAEVTDVTGAGATEVVEGSTNIEDKSKRKSRSKSTDSAKTSKTTKATKTAKSTKIENTENTVKTTTKASRTNKTNNNTEKTVKDKPAVSRAKTAEKSRKSAADKVSVVNDGNDGRKKILFIASEAMPFVTTGGMGEVVGTLPKNLCAADKDIDVRVIMPLYKSIKEKYKEQLESLGYIYTNLSWRRVYCGIYKTESDGITFYFIDNNDYFGLRDDCYGYFDDGERFAFFGKAALDILETINFVPDIIHMHDWQSAVSSVYLKTIYADRKIGKKQLSKIKTVFTIHNMEYQGKYNISILEDVFGIPFRYRDIVDFDGIINLMKGAMICSDIITTVSPSYAEEIHDFRFAHKLETIVNMQSAKIRGILNGIDYDSYNPLTDSKIFANYDADSINKKAENKLQLQTIMNLKQDEHIPVIVMITRLAKQKGLDLLNRAITEIGQMPIQLVIFGTGAREYELLCESFGERFPDKIVYRYGFNGELARRMYAGADMVLMPSEFEPCGISQMIAAKYGTVAIVSETGGLKDTITPYSDEGENQNTGIGFTFRRNSSSSMIEAITYACSVYNDREKWHEIMKRGMSRDFSWGQSAKEYIKMYNEILENK